MSTLQVGTVKSRTANTPPVFQDSAGVEVGQLARAWVDFNGTGTVAIRKAFNVSSIVDNGVGDYSLNFTNALPDANYSYALSCGTTGTTAKLVYALTHLTTPSASLLRIGVSTLTTPAPADDDRICAIIFD